MLCSYNWLSVLSLFTDLSRIKSLLWQLNATHYKPAILPPRCCTICVRSQCHICNSSQWVGKWMEPKWISITAVQRGLWLDSEPTVLFCGWLGMERCLANACLYLKTLWSVPILAQVTLMCFWPWKIASSLPVRVCQCLWAKLLRNHNKNVASAI